MKRIVQITCASLLCLWLLIPTSDIVAPDWSVLVTDTAGHPIEGARVTVHSQQYTVEAQDTEVEKLTDRNGHVHFEGRKLHSNYLVKFRGMMRNLASQGVHASFGSHTYVLADKNGYGDPTTLDLFSKNQRERRANGAAHQSSHILLLECSAGYSGMGCDFPTDPEQPILPLKL